MNKITTIAFAAMLLGATAFAQKSKDEVPKNWHQLDPTTTGYNGISLQKAYDLASSQNTSYSWKKFLEDYPNHDEASAIRKTNYQVRS